MDINSPGKQQAAQGEAGQAGGRGGYMRLVTERKEEAIHSSLLRNLMVDMLLCRRSAVLCAAACLQPNRWPLRGTQEATPFGVLVPHLHMQ